MSERLVSRVCTECGGIPCYCNEGREILEEQLIFLQKKRDEIIKKKLDSLKKYISKSGVIWVKYYDVKKLLERL